MFGKVYGDMYAEASYKYYLKKYSKIVLKKIKLRVNLNFSLV